MRRRRAGRAGHRGAARRATCPTRRCCAIADAIGYPLMLKAVAGGGGKGMRMVATREELSERAARRAIRSGLRVRRLGRVPRAPHHAAAAHRSAAPRRSAWHRPAVRRARVLAAAPASESDRGEPVAGRHAGSQAPPCRRPRPRWRARSTTPTPARSSSCSTSDGDVLLPRDEHAAAGRASDHRDGDGRRSRRLADPDRARRARSRSIPMRCSRRAVTRSSAASTPRIPTTASCRRRAAFTACACRTGPGVRDDSGVYEGGEVPIFYDPMISKLITWGESRAARARPHAPRARRIRGPRHQDDDPVLPVDAGRRGLRRGAVRHQLHRSQARRARTATRCRAPDAEHEELAAIAAALAQLVPARDQHRRSCGPSRAAGALLRGWRRYVRPGRSGGSGRAGQSALTRPYPTDQTDQTDQTSDEDRSGDRRPPANGRDSCGSRTAITSRSTAGLRLVDAVRVGADRLVADRPRRRAHGLPQRRGVRDVATATAASTCTSTGFAFRSSCKAGSDGARVMSAPRAGRGPAARHRADAGQGRARAGQAPATRVQPRQGLVVVEAMKMENELRAARDGHGARGVRRRRSIGRRRDGPGGRGVAVVLAALYRHAQIGRRARRDSPGDGAGVGRHHRPRAVAQGERPSARDRSGSTGRCTSAGSACRSDAASSSSRTCASTGSRPTRRPGSSPSASTISLTWGALFHREVLLRSASK